MRTPAKIHCITHSVLRSECFYDGFVEFTPTALYMDFDAETYSVRIGVSDDLTTITRMGDDNYTMMLEEGKSTLLDLGPFTVTVTTTRLRLKKSEHRIDFTAQYRLGNDPDAMRVIVHATY